MTLLLSFVKLMTLIVMLISAVLLVQKIRELKIFYNALNNSLKEWASRRRKWIKLGVDPNTINSEQTNHARQSVRTDLQKLIRIRNVVIAIFLILLASLYWSHRLFIT